MNMYRLKKRDGLEEEQRYRGTNSGAAALDFTTNVFTRKKIAIGGELNWKRAFSCPIRLACFQKRAIFAATKWHASPSLRSKRT